MSGLHALHERSAHAVQCRDAVVSPLAKNDAAVVALSISLGVLLRASMLKLTDRSWSGSMNILASSSATFAHAQAWPLAACFLLGAGVLSWTFQEAQEVGAKELMGERTGAAEVCEDGPVAEERRLTAAAPAWDPLDFSADDEGEADLGDEGRWRSLEIKHGHLSMLAHVGFVAMRQSSQSADADSSCSTLAAEQSLFSGDSSAAGSMSDFEARAMSEAEEAGSRALAAALPGRWRKTGHCRGSAAGSAEGRGVAGPDPEAGKVAMQADGTDRAAPKNAPRDDTRSTPDACAPGGTSGNLSWSLPRGSMWSDFAEDEALFSLPAELAYAALAEELAPEPQPDGGSVHAPPGGAPTLFSLPRGSVWSELPDDDGHGGATPEGHRGSEDAQSRQAPEKRRQRQRWSQGAAERSAGQQGQPRSSGRRGPRNSAASAQPTVPETAPVPVEATKPEWRQVSAEVRQGEARQGEARRYASRLSAPAVSSRPANTRRCTKNKSQSDKDLKMPEILRILENVDQERVLIIRKMKKLGFNSAAILRTYFEEFGAVENVYVSHSHLVGRMRPSSLGFVVMASRSARQASLVGGTQQVVQEVPVFVSAFEQLEQRELDE